jgi:hypothetical protein
LDLAATTTGVIDMASALDMLVAQGGAQQFAPVSSYYKGVADRQQAEIQQQQNALQQLQFVAQQQEAARKAAEAQMQQRNRQQLASVLAQQNPLAAMAFQAGINDPVKQMFKPAAQNKMLADVQAWESMTPQQRELYRGVMEARRSPPVSISVGGDSAPFKPSPGYMAVQDEQGGWRMAPVPGGPQDPNTLTTQERNFRQQARRAKSITNRFLNEYREKLGQYGMEVWPGGAKLELQSWHKAILDQLRELQGMGALQQADITFLGGQLIDPTEIQNYPFYSKEDVFRQLKEFEKQIEIRATFDPEEMAKNRKMNEQAMQSNKSAHPQYGVPVPAENLSEDGDYIYDPQTKEFYERK